MKLHRAALALAVLACLPLRAGAETAVTIYSSAQPGALNPATFRSGGEGYTVPGYALVKEERAFALTRGRTVLRVSDVPALIDPTTVSFESLTDPRSTRVVEQSFEFDLTSTAKLLSRYLDKEISVEQTRGQAVESFTGTLISTLGGVTLRNADGGIRVLSGYAGIRLPTLPGGLISKPTLVWDIETGTTASHKARFAYQTGGMTWWTDYNLTYSEPQGGGCRLDVGAWVTIVNQSGASFADARLKLVAGDVQRAQPRALPAAQPAMAGRVMELKKADGFEEKAFFEYHLYTLGRPTSLANNSTKQIELFPMAPGVACRKDFVYFGQAQAYPYYGSVATDRNFGVQSNRKVDVHLHFRNAKDNGMGIPLPAGKVRVARQDEADRSLEFIGEDLIDHTARNENVQIKLGSAFDVVGERRQVDFRIDTSAKWIEEDIEVKVRNQKAEPVTVIVKEVLYRWSNWTIPRKTHAFEKQDSRTVHFPLSVAKESEAVLRYTVRYTW